MRRILTSSVVVMACMAAIGATAALWLLFTQPAEAVVVLAHGDANGLLLVMLDIIASALTALLDYL